jgi:hypothetical protein
MKLKRNKAKMSDDEEIPELKTKKMNLAEE